MATLDSTELDEKAPGEALEALVRLIGEVPLVLRSSR
jgi:hypothetical protein